MDEEKEDLILRDLLNSTACQFTQEEWQKIESEAPWIKLTDEGVECNQGWKNLIKSLNNV